MLKIDAIYETIGAWISQLIEQRCLYLVLYSGKPTTTELDYEIHTNTLLSTTDA